MKISLREKYLYGIFTCSDITDVLFFFSQRLSLARACLKNHSYNLYTLICGIFCPHSVDVARYAALIRAKSPTNYDAHLAESIFQTRSRVGIRAEFSPISLQPSQFFSNNNMAVRRQYQVLYFWGFL